MVTLPPRVTARSAWSLDAVLERVADELLLPAEAELAENVAHVVLDGLLGDEEVRADLLVGVPARDELQHLAFTL